VREQMIGRWLALAGLLAILVAGLGACGDEDSSDSPLLRAPEFRVVHALNLGKRTTAVPARIAEPAIIATSVGTQVIGISLPAARRRTLLELGSKGNPIALASPSWAPDGRSFVVSGGIAVGRPRVLVAAPRQGGRRRTIAGDVFDPAPKSVTFSPDGRYLVFPARDRGLGLYAYDLRRRRARQVVAGPVAQDSAVTWSPDGHSVAFDREDGGIVVFDFSARSAHLLARDGAGAAWSPNGKWIAFATALGVAARRCGEDGCGPTTDIDVVRLDGSGRRRVTRTPGDETNPSWSPDSKWLVAQLLPGRTYYESSMHLVAFAVDGSCYRRLGSGRRESLEVGPNAWRPGARAAPRC
jgi:dipeptidyl aminopeptidase/acylaminoacyl peptidase